MKLYAYSLPEVSGRAGWLKIGETTQDVEKRLAQTGHELDLRKELVWQDAAVTDRSHIDKLIHAELQRQGFAVRQFTDTKTPTEWVKCSVADIEKAFAKIRERLYAENQKRQELCDKFYLEIRNWYFWTAKTGDDPYSVASPDYALRLIIRLLLCFFLREKKLMPDHLFDEQWLRENLKSGNEYRYYKAILRNLFFNALNKPLGKRGELENKKLISRPNAVKTAFSKIPFLNGGLFSEQRGDDFPLNDDYFFSESRTRHIKELDGDYPVMGIIRLLSGYKFRLSASDELFDNEAAVEPEFIGKVFESLLSCIDADGKTNKQKVTGSYYTPNEVVSYMVNQALDSFLQDGDDLLKCKILDPACGSGAFVIGVLNEVMNRFDGERLWSPEKRYQEKLHILNKVIYGADIQPIAVQITVLRAFLSLLQELTPNRNPLDNYGVAALPNLNYHFVCADTLRAMRADDMFFAAHQEQFADLLELKRDYFDRTNVDERRELAQRIHAQETALAAASTDPDIKKLCAWNYDDNCPAPLFDSRWMFGVKEFDIVVGNPPYVQVSKSIFHKEQYPYSVGKDPGKQNLYKVFIEAAYKWTKLRTGIGCLITQSSLLGDLSATHTRELLLTKTQVLQIVEFPKKAPTAEGQVFKSVLQGTCICLFRKKVAAENELMLSVGNDTTSIRHPEFAAIKQRDLLDNKRNFAIPLFRKGEAEIYRKIIDNSTPLKELAAMIAQGDLNLTTDQKSYSPTVTPIKLFRGCNIHRYSLDDEVGEYLLPAKFPEKVAYNQAHPLLICQEVTGTVDPRRLIFTLIEKPGEKFAFGHTVQKIVLKNLRQSSTVLAILNSSLLDWFFRKTSTNNHIGGYELAMLPLAKTLADSSAMLANLVEQILAAKKNGRDTTDLETQIDARVYELYGLTTDEIAIVEGKQIIRPSRTPKSGCRR
ncbi:hypothetical protein AGMMS49959_07390 [Planctomycetales bacterium]|nr:hypothetical protein AGMMS49959_07390 [Planctomycetales bacterium]